MDKKKKKIDASVLKESKKHGLNDNQTKLVQQTIERKTGGNTDTNAKIYKETMARDEDMTTEVASVEYNRTLKLDKVKNTIRDVLKAHNINKNTILNTHIDIIDKAYRINQLNTALIGNTKLMELEGMTQIQPTNQTNIQINIEKMSDEQINDKLKDVITIN